jgi:hypothetical protein
MSNILKLPLVALTIEIGTNEPLTDAWGYVDSSNNPISGAGITLQFMVRTTASDPAALIVASNVSGAINGVAQNGTIAWGGAGGNIVVPNIPVSVIGGMPPGTYAGEVLAIADGYQRRIAEITLIIDQGIVR